MTLLPAGCELWFSEEPVTVLSCNPYTPGSELRLGCTVTGDPNSFTIHWVFSPTSGGTNTLSNSQGVDIQDIHDMDNRKSRIRLSNIADDDGAGMYSCQVRFNNGTVIGESNKLQLLSSVTYSEYPPCDDEHHSEESTKCLIDQATVEALVATTTTMQPSTDNGETPDSALYAVIGVIAVFCVVIISLTVIIVLLYRKKCGRVSLKTAGEYVYCYHRIMGIIDHH